jgi:hypothetical protein
MRRSDVKQLCAAAVALDLKVCDGGQWTLMGGREQNARMTHVRNYVMNTRDRVVIVVLLTIVHDDECEDQSLRERSAMIPTGVASMLSA